MPPLNIAIVGAGVGGLAAAIGLAQNGHKITMYERSNLDPGVGFAFRITANSDRCLKHLGIDTIEGGAVSANIMRRYRMDGEVFGHIHENQDKEQAKRGTSVFAFRVVSLLPCYWQGGKSHR